ncbi:MAG TPA: histidine kinase [Verrucomicrobiae bacterium]|nr:histidine kinase [Verrucomicrobiae bacterium]
MTNRYVPLRRVLLLLAGLFALCSLLAGLSVLQGYVCDLGMDQHPDLGPMLRQEFKGWYALGFVSLGVLWFANRRQPMPNRIGLWLLEHIVAALFFAGVYAVFTSWLVAGEKSVMHPGQILTFSYLMGKFWLHYVVVYFLIYWVVMLGELGWHYYNRFREREVETAQLQRELVEARLEALRMQLNPHFLFNTLHAISALIHENPAAADRVLARLSELLRLSLDQSKPQEVPLSEELAFLDRYLEIEQTRFAERLTVQKQIAAETQPALVPYLILQPLVENAIRHGIEPREGPGLLRVCAHLRDGQLVLRVVDNGDGLGDGISRPQEGIGLSNTRARLRHLYGDNCNFELAPAEGGGLEARVVVPFRTSREAGASYAPSAQPLSEATAAGAAPARRAPGPAKPSLGAAGGWNQLAG